MTTLTMQDEKRIEVIQRLFRSELTVGSAAVLLGISERQCYRIKRRVRKQGAKGVVHGNRGRPCKRKLDAIFQKQLALRSIRYNPVSVAERMARGSNEVGEMMSLI